MGNQFNKSQSQIYAVLIFGFNFCWCKGVCWVFYKTHLAGKLLRVPCRSPNISPGLIQSHKHFLVGIYTRGDLYSDCLYTEPLLCLEFFTSVICFSRKRNEIRQKKQCSCSKRPFYYMAANKTRDVFNNLRPLA